MSALLHPMVQRADELAECRHRGQFRGDCVTPYIHHPRAVARILADEAGCQDPVMLAAALLHDTVEDTGLAVAEIAAEFGRNVAELVAELTNDQTLTGAASKAEQLRRVFSHDAAAIKIADKTANLRDLVAAPPRWSAGRVRAYRLHAAALVLRIGEPHPQLSAIFQTAYRQVLVAGN